ncbi:MAG TPA: hypothetical protein VFF59_12270, partial [Anaerolineae bacterium]|nr:hypothetical protein [Anaerolineae bacterium]
FVAAPDRGRPACRCRPFAAAFPVLTGRRAGPWRMIPKKPVPDLIRDGYRFSQKIMREHISGESGEKIMRR